MRKTCEHCFKIFETRPKWRIRKYCSNECRYSSRKTGLSKHENMRRRAREIKRQRKEFTSAIKLFWGCADCGYNDNSAALHFDHVKGEKEFNIGESGTINFDKLMNEILKCEVRCANCHAIKTYGNDIH